MKRETAIEFLDSRNLAALQRRHNIDIIFGYKDANTQIEWTSVSNRSNFQLQEMLEIEHKLFTKVED